jgi:hypothetical protein
MQFSKKIKNQRVFTLLKSSMIESVLINVTVISLSIYKIKESAKKSSSILLQSLILTIFIANDMNLLSY